MNIPVFGTGLVTGLSLIVAIGAQNAFVLRQGLRNEHVFAVCLICGLSDALLITLGVTSFRQIAALLPWLDPIMRYGGAAFLIWYGAKSLYSALRSSEALAVQEGAGFASVRTVLLTCLALTWLNPHVYLDTVVLLGTISTPVSGIRGVVCGGRRDRLAPVLLFSRLRRDLAAADLLEAGVLANSGNFHHANHVVDRF
ncbi:L-lysine exporter family protein LysE/ArgO [Sinorhizobium medicae]